MWPDIKKILQPRPRKYRNIARHLSPLALTREAGDRVLRQQDVFQDLISNRGTGRFLGYFSKLGIQYALKQFGILAHLEGNGLPGGQVGLDTTEPYRHCVWLEHTLGSKKLLSAEVVARQGRFNLPGGTGASGRSPGLNLIVIEWFLLQHPLKQFTRQRPQLPGQDHPGLGVGLQVYEMFYWMARRMGSDGVMLIPNYLHTGIFYGRQFLFIDPELQAVFYALKNHGRGKTSLDQLTWACAEGQLINRVTNQVFQWQPSPMVLPVTRTSKDYFYSPWYSQEVRARRSRYNLEINPGYRKHYDKTWKARPGE